MKAIHFFALVSLLFFCTNTEASVVFVDQDATGLNNGNNWTNAYTDLQDAIAASIDGDEIWVAKGSYKPTSSIDRDINFHINKDINLYGGFDGTETARIQRDWSENLTSLNGDIGNTNIDTDNSYNVVEFDGCDAVLDGFSVYSAFREFSSSEIKAGAIYIHNDAHVDIHRCSLLFNTAPEAAALGINSGHFSLDNCVISMNHCDSGGSIHLRNSSTGKIAQCTIGLNDWVQPTGSVIAGFPSASLELYNSIIWNNDAHQATGLPTFTIENCILDIYNPGLLDTYSNILDDDPEFTNQFTLNYSIPASSPAVDFGNNIHSTLNQDKAHNPRIWNGTVDLGCYENEDNRTIHVDEEATGFSNGSNWENAFTDLQNAINESREGDQIWVANGIYFPTTSTLRTFSFEPKSNVPLYGGFEGTETSLIERNWLNNSTILSGNIGVLSIDLDNSYHVLVYDDPAGNFEIDGFAIQKGYANSPSNNNDFSGGFLVEASNQFIMRNCSVNSNYASSGSGGWIISCEEGAEFTNCVFQDNTGGSGSALLFNDDVFLENCLFQGNFGFSCVENNTNGSVDMRGCTFTENTGTVGALIQGSGGASNLEGQIINTVIWDNTIIDTDPIENDSNLDVSHSIIQGNPLDADQEGAEVYYQDPLFVNAGASNFALCGGSIGSDKGDNSVVTTSTDLVLNERIQNGTVDMGAFEGNNTPVIIYVDQNATGANDGSSWADGYTNLQDALTNLECTDEIWVAEGTYKPTLVASPGVNFQISENVNIFGGFNGTENIRSERNWDEHVCKISGEIGDPSLASDNSLNLFTISGAQVLIDGLVIEQSYGDPMDAAAEAGALRVTDLGSVELRHCLFRNNTAYHGPVVNVIDGIANMDNCLIRDNHANSDGILWCNAPTSNSITECTITQNDFIQEFGSAIGGQVNGSFEVYNSIIWDNDGHPAFGSSPVTVDHCIVDVYTFDAGDVISNMLQDDPLFSDPAGNNFTLSSISPAINAGHNSYSNLSLDQNHESRVQYGTVDLGCFEFTNAVIIYVDADASGNNNGTSWTNAFNDLQDGIANFTGTEEIWVAEGTYYPTDDDDYEDVFRLEDHMKIYGGFNGTEFFINDRNIASNPVILSGEIGSPSDPTDNSQHVVVAINLTAPSSIDGVMITGGYADDEASPNGGGIWIILGEQNHVTLSNCTFENNHAEKHGGGLFTVADVDEDVHCIIQNCVFRGNSAAIAGGGLLIRDGTSADVSDSVFDNNLAPEGSGLASFGALNLANNSFHDNLGDVGTIYLESHDFAFYDCEFSNNHAAVSSGVVALNEEASVEFHHSKFMQNSAGTVGGISDLWSTSALFENCLFVENFAPESGIASLNDAAASFTNCTFVGNESTVAAVKPGLINESSGTTSGVTANCIFWNNNSPTDVHPALQVTHSILRDFTGNSNLFCDPMFTDPIGLDFTLGSNSPAFNTGDDSYLTQTTDLNGLTRMQFGTVDRGCYEAQLCESPHDFCADAINLVIDDVAQFGSNSCANANGDVPLSCATATGRTVWYSFVAPESGSVEILGTGLDLFSALFDLRMGLFEGGCNGLNELACVNDNPMSQADETLIYSGLIPGQAYQVRLEGAETQQGAWKIQILETAPSSCLGDFNMDGERDTADLLLFLTDFDCSSSCVYDLTGDDATNTSDLLEFLTVFGTTCP